MIASKKIKRAMMMVWSIGFLICRRLASVIADLIFVFCVHCVVCVCVSKDDKFVECC